MPARYADALLISIIKTFSLYFVWLLLHSHAVPHSVLVSAGTSSTHYFIVIYVTINSIIDDILPPLRHPPRISTENSRSRQPVRLLF
jgi:hypothetical protein